MDTLPAMPLTHLYYSATRGAPRAMTNRRKHLPIMATVIGLALAGCGGGGGGQTISVTVDSGRRCAGHRESSWHRHGNSAPASRCGGASTQANHARGGTHGGRWGQCYGDGRSRWSRFRIPGQHASRRCVEPCGIAGQRDGIDGAYNCLYEHRETRGSRSATYIPLTKPMP